MMGPSDPEASGDEERATGPNATGLRTTQRERWREERDGVSGEIATHERDLPQRHAPPGYLFPHMADQAELGAGIEPASARL